MVPNHTDTMTLRRAWACLDCDAGGDADNADKLAERHTQTTGHGTLAHISDGHDVVTWAYLVQHARGILQAVPTRQ